MPNSVRFGRAAANSALSRTANLPGEIMTVMFWLCIRGNGSGFAGGNTPNFWNYDDNGGVGHSNAALLNDASLTLGLWNDASVVTGSALTSGRWYHIAITKNGTSGGGNFLLYLNGVQDISHTPAGITSARMWLGTDLGNEWTDCNMAAIKIWNRVLTAAEIVKEMPYVLPVDWAGLNSAYPLPNGWDRLPTGLLVPRGGLTRWRDISGQKDNDWTETGTLDTDLGSPIKFAREPLLRRARVAVLGGTTPVSNTQDAAYEALGGIALALALPYEVLQALATATTIPLESLQAIATAAAAAYEALQGIAATGQLSYETLQGLATALGVPYEALAGLAATGQPGYESTGQIASTNGIPYESLAGLAASNPAAYEALTALLASNPIGYEVLGGLAGALVIPYEAQGTAGSVLNSATLSYEVLQQLAQLGTIAEEALQGVQAAPSTPIESVGGLAIAVALSFEALQQLSQSGTVPYDAVKALLAGQAVCFDTIGGVAVALPIPYESTGLVKPEIRILVFSGETFGILSLGGQRFGVLTRSGNTYAVQRT